MRGQGRLPTDGSVAVWLPARQGLYCCLPDSADPAPGLLGPRARARRARPEARAETSCHALPGQEGEIPQARPSSLLPTTLVGRTGPVAASPSRVRAAALHLLMGMSGRPSPRSP